MSKYNCPSEDAVTKKICRRCEKWIEAHATDAAGAARCEDGGRFLPARDTPSASNSFTDGEVQVLSHLIQEVVRGPHYQIARNKDFPSVLRKVARMRESIDREKNLVERAARGAT